MSTTDHAPERPAATGSIYDRLCFICEDWVAGGDDDTLAICEDCRSTEPCRRCGGQDDDCECPEGPDHLVWLPAVGRG